MHLLARSIAIDRQSGELSWIRDRRSAVFDTAELSRIAIGIGSRPRHVPTRRNRCVEKPIVLQIESSRRPRSLASFTLDRGEENGASMGRRERSVQLIEIDSRDRAPRKFLNGARAARRKQLPVNGVTY